MCVLDAAPFLILDKASEKAHKFTLSASLKKALEKNMLEGYKIHVTKSVLPPADQMKGITLEKYVIN